MKENTHSSLSHSPLPAESYNPKVPELGRGSRFVEDMRKGLQEFVDFEDVALESTFISCSLRTVSLLANPDFLALSYTWGDPKIRKSIAVDGTSVDVTKNLWDALCHIRKDDEEITIWVDALCINQTDFEEKNSQVPLMKDIYQMATGTMVWVGLASNNSDALMQRLDEVGKDAFQAGILDVFGREAQKVLRPQGVGEVLPARHLRIRKSLEELSDKLGFDFPYTALGPFNSRPYWTRVWIIQEVSVSQQVIILCGTKEVPFPHFAAASIFLNFHKTRTSIRASFATSMDPSKGSKLNEMIALSGDDGRYNYLIGSRRRFQNEAATGHDDLLGLLKKTCLSHDYAIDQRATDYRDVIYGVLGMAADVESLGIKPDYRKSHTVQDVYTETTKALLKQGHTIVLAWCGQPLQAPGLTGLPSWVPDFTSPILPPCCEDKNFPLFSASSNNTSASQQAIFDSPKGPQFLALKAQKVDTIKFLSSPWHGEDFNEESCHHYLTAIISYCEMAKSLPCKPGSPLNSINWAEAHWRIPSADQSYDGARKRATPALEKDYNELKFILENMNSLQGLDAIQNIIGSDSCNFYRLAIGYQHARKAFMSDEGYVGLVPATARNGDMIVVVPGANMPFVLRECFGQYTHRLVGEAYVHGIMDGEFMEMAPVAETFHLS
jgi:hypothetical protein